MSFLNKYVPQKIDDLFGNKFQINQAIKWIKNFKTNEKKVLLICGPPGIGKTSLAHVILKTYNYYPIEFIKNNQSKKYYDDV